VNVALGTAAEKNILFCRSERREKSLVDLSASGQKKERFLASAGMTEWSRYPAPARARLTKIIQEFVF
jgi:hypothetical protein